MALYEALSSIEAELQRLQRVEHDLSEQVTALEAAVTETRTETHAAEGAEQGLRMQAALFGPARHEAGAARDVARATASSERLREGSVECGKVVDSLRHRVAAAGGTTALQSARVTVERQLAAAARARADSKTALERARGAEGAAGVELREAQAAVAAAEARTHAIAQQTAHLSDAAQALSLEWQRGAQAGLAAEGEHAAAAAAAAAAATHAVAAGMRLEKARARERL
jgi:chromosome segregation ATPase